jgi:hypothetical protein
MLLKKVDKLEPLPKIAAVQKSKGPEQPSEDNELASQKSKGL